MKKDIVEKIIRYNRNANMAIAARDIRAAGHFLCKLHKLEIRDKVEIGAYRVRNIQEVK